MSLQSIKERLRDVPGIQDLHMQILAGRQTYSFGGKIVALDAGASESQVIEAIRAAVSSSAVAQMPAGVPVAGGAQIPAVPPAEIPSASAALLPQVNAVAATLQPSSPQGSSMTTTTTPPAAHALSIKDALANHAQKLDTILQAQVALLNTTLEDQLNTVQSGTTAVIGKVQAHTDDFKAILGSFTNALDAENI